jgi:ubiquinone/menaquinone biosynthesis C-methylase UbiE
MSEPQRLRHAYARRNARSADARYVRSPGDRYIIARRDEALARLLRRRRLLPLAGKRIVDVGCGSGDVLRTLVRLGAEPALLAGVDLLPERVAAASDRSPEIDLRVADAAALPFADATFDLALQFTLISSVLDDAVRRRIAAETLRVLRPGGTLVWYDFVWNPLNRATRGVPLRDLRALYPGCAIDSRRVTLAPPLARLLARVSPLLCRIAEGPPFLRTHLLAAIVKSPV